MSYPCLQVIPTCRAIIYNQYETSKIQMRLGKVCFLAVFSSPFCQFLTDWDEIGHTVPLNQFCQFQYSQMSIRHTICLLLTNETKYRRSNLSGKIVHLLFTLLPQITRLCQDSCTSTSAMESYDLVAGKTSYVKITCTETCPSFQYSGFTEIKIWGIPGNEV